MNIVTEDVWYVKYWNVPLMIHGVVVFPTLEMAEKYEKNLSKFDSYQCLEITGPHPHSVVK